MATRIMSKVEAIQAMLKGEKVVNDSIREEGQYAYFNKKDFVYKNAHVEFDLSCHPGSNWKLYEEPKEELIK